VSVDITDLPDVSEPLPWHRGVWERLGEQRVAGRLPHALLLAGAEGIGKARFALALARLLLCAQPANGLNCGQCHPCRLSASGSHGDFCWLQPEQSSRVIKIDQVRQAISFVNQTASFGACKVVVLCPADAMNANAANALLKALEEPVPGTFLVLVCHRLQGVPATIRSRCQIDRLSTPAMEQADAWLRTLTEPEVDVAGLLALADGRPLAAQRLLRENRVQSVAAARGAIQGVLSGRLSALEAGKQLAETEAGEFLLQFQCALHQLLQRQGPGGLRRPEARAAFYLDDEISRLRRALQSGANPNASLLVDALLARCERELGGALYDGSM
jgi:DNA polymerase-3 subunit delta'